MTPRDYSRLRFEPARDPDAAMKAFVDAAWDALAPQGVSWIGFYFKDERTDTMTLGHRRDKPACSPIGLHGVCGRGWREQRTIIVRDVRLLGPDYVACDPRDQSEVVVPLFDRGGVCTGVLDVDSFDVGAFTEYDARELARLLIEAGLTSPRAWDVPILI
ncbi:MAG: GAF domain-containing protein [Phycisphaerales bacterium]